MFITITDASKGKPYTLVEPIDNSHGNAMIAIQSLTLYVGWYNIYKPQTWRWTKRSEGTLSTEVKLQAGLYSFQELVERLTNEIEGFSITVNKANGKIDMIIPPDYDIFLPDPIRYALGLEDEGWLSAGEYEGDRAVEFLPKRILIYLKQLSTTNNLVNKNQQLQNSQLLGVIPMCTKSFGESYIINFENPLFKQLSPGSISQLDLDLKVQWGNGIQHKLDNHDQPIDLVLEINK